MGYKPRLYLSSYLSEVRSAAKGSGDNAYIYQNPGIIRGTIPVNENRFQISGSMDEPAGEFLFTLKDAMIIRIKDEGCGIPKDKMPKLSEAFYTTKDDGTGLGLMVTYKIIEEHQGKIQFESEVGVGTTVEIVLPIH